VLVYFSDRPKSKSDQVNQSSSMLKNCSASGSVYAAITGEHTIEKVKLSDIRTTS
jgi:hypothetical protein